ncbi:MAG: hypothetical protein H7237_09280 [Alkalinema sp. FL-bin-369]|nr:hypothetical protein [Leptolyngbyaceae cyanobacterium LF-bin-369]
MLNLSSLQNETKNKTVTPKSPIASDPPEMRSQADKGHDEQVFIDY